MQILQWSWFVFICFFWHPWEENFLVVLGFSVFSLSNLFFSVQTIFFFIHGFIPYMTSPCIAYFSLIFYLPLSFFSIKARIYFFAHSCMDTGYLACARCSASGVCIRIDPISVSSLSDRPLRVPATQRCLNCSGAGKV